MALVVIAVCLVVAERLPTTTSRWWRSGAMASNRLLGQVVEHAVLDGTSRSVAAWLAFITVMVVLATGWRLILGEGPLERLLSSSSGAAAALAVRHLAPRPPPSS